MNFLAHLHLSPPTARSMIGNLLPDLTRGRTPAGLDAEVAVGAATHRRVDAFTDAHPLHARSRRRIFADHGRFSSILIDMFYDHFLARDWWCYHPQPLTVFVAQAHHRLLSRRDLMPPRMRPIVTRMVEQNWLTSYAEVDGLAVALERMARHFSKRFDRDIQLAHAVTCLEAQGDDLAADFHAFYPQLMKHVQNVDGQTDRIRTVARQREPCERLLIFR